jgi:predicted RNA binding protein YcfA (HicA-like mRNA interferase family)
MRRLPAVKPKEAIAALSKAGFDIVRIRGSHYHLLHPVTRRRATIPYHAKELSRSTLSSILNQSGLSPEQFTELL